MNGSTQAQEEFRPIGNKSCSQRVNLRLLLPECINVVHLIGKVGRVLSYERVSLLLCNLEPGMEGDS